MRRPILCVTDAARTRAATSLRIRSRIGRPSRRRLSVMFARRERRLAEREGFEPSVEFPLHTLSKRAPSTTRTSLRLSGIRSLAEVLDRRPTRAVYEAALSRASLRRLATAGRGLGIAPSLARA